VRGPGTTGGTTPRREGPAAAPTCTDERARTCGRMRSATLVTGWSARVSTVRATCTHMGASAEARGRRRGLRCLRAPTDSRRRRVLRRQRRRGPPQRKAPPDGHRLPRAGPHRRAHPRRLQPGRGTPLGRADGGQAADPRGAPSPVTRRRRGTDDAGHGAVGRAPRRPGRAGQRAMGGQPAPPMGFLHAGRPQHPAVQPAAVDARLRRRLRPGARAGAPARARARRALLGAGRALSAGRAGARVPRGGRAGHALVLVLR